MARPSATAARTVGGACLNVAFVALLLAFYCLSCRAVDSDVSPSFSRNGGGALIGEHGHGWCDGLRRIERHEDRCGYLAADGCRPRGYVDYLYLFCCVLGGERRRVLAYGAMAAWLAALFYVLGDTAAVYFCSAAEPVAGHRRGHAPVARERRARRVVHRRLVRLAREGRDHRRGAERRAWRRAVRVLGRARRDRPPPRRTGDRRRPRHLLPGRVLPAPGPRRRGSGARCGRDHLLGRRRLLLALPRLRPRRRLHAGPLEQVPRRGGRPRHLRRQLLRAPQRRRGKVLRGPRDQDPLSPDTAPLLQYYAGESDTEGGAKKKMSGAFLAAVRVLELLLRLPRRLTIPDASKDRWSKPAAVTAATLAPLFLSCLCSHSTGHPSLAVFLGGLSGLTLGLLDFLTTDSAAPPTGRLLSAWLAGGFVMSVAWAYVVAGEVLSLLVSAGVVLSVDTAALGVTVLSWGNSLGDLVSNVAVASRGGAGGAQVAVSGCYSGPMFNVLVGLGLSMLVSCWAGYPRPVEIPTEAGLFQTLGFVVAGILWAVVMLPRRGMKVDRTLGFGLLAMYFCFLCVNVSQVLGPRGQQ